MARSPRWLRRASHARQSSAVFLLPASREQCPHAGSSASLCLLCGDSSPSETLSLDALSTVPLSLPIPTGMLCCSHTHRLGGMPPVQGEGFAFFLLLSDRLSHTEINPADITACLCLEKKDVCGC